MIPGEYPGVGVPVKLLGEKMGVSGLSGRTNPGSLLTSARSSTLGPIGESGMPGDGHGLRGGTGEGQGLDTGVELGLEAGEEPGLCLMRWSVKSWGRGPRRRLLGRPTVVWDSAGRLEPRPPLPAPPPAPIRSTSASSTIMDIFCNTKTTTNSISHVPS